MNQQNLSPVALEPDSSQRLRSQSIATALVPSAPRLYLLLIVLVCSGCSAVAQSQPSTSNTASHPTTDQPITSGGNQATKRFKLRLTLTAPDDLKVKEGDVVVMGQIVADRVRDRSRLQFQKESLVREIGRLKQLAIVPIPAVRHLPDTDYAEEAAAIEHVRQKAFEASKHREQQQRKLDVLANLEQSELPESVIPHEQLLLEQRQQEENQAQAEVQLSLGKLSKAKELKADKEYTHSLEVSKRAIAIKESELKTQGQIADLDARLSQVEIQLSQLSAVRSPYSGKIQRIKFIGQNDQNLSVELVMVVSGDSSHSVGSSSGEAPSSTQSEGNSSSGTANAENP